MAQASRDDWSFDRVELARASPTGLGLASDRRYLRPRHLEILDERLVNLTRQIIRYRAAEDRLGQGPRLMVYMHPRGGKSYTTSELFPTWFLGHFPDRRVVVASYGQQLPLGWSRRARDWHEAYGPMVFGTQVKQDSRSVHQWETTAGGGMKAVGVGAGITGFGADLAVIDDPFKDQEEAQSEVIRQKVWDWYVSTLHTRLMPGGAVLLIMTRWHEDDLAGRLLRKDPTRHPETGRKLPEGQYRTDEEADGETWDVLCIPAIAEEDHPMVDGPDPLGRMPGEAMWPDMFPAPVLETKRRTYGLYWFTAMYQQRPAPEEGGMFSRSNFRYWQWADKAREIVLYEREDGGSVLCDLGACTWFQTADIAATEKTTSDWTVVSTWCKTPWGDLLLIDVAREKMETPKQPGWASAQFFKWPRVVWQGIENKTFGLSLIQAQKRKGLPVKALEADTDKVSRATTMGVYYENHQVFHPAVAPWLDAWEKELTDFPNGVHDDQVDTAAYAGLEFSKVTVGKVSTGEGDPSSVPVTSAIQGGF